MQAFTLNRDDVTLMAQTGGKENSRQAARCTDVPFDTLSNFYRLTAVLCVV